MRLFVSIGLGILFWYCCLSYVRLLRKMVVVFVYDVRGFDGSAVVCFLDFFLTIGELLRSVLFLGLEFVFFVVYRVRVVEGVF